MIIKNCKHLAKAASNNNTTSTAAATAALTVTNKTKHDQLHLLCKFNMKYRHNKQQHYQQHHHHNQHPHHLPHHHHLPHGLYSSLYYSSSIVVLCVISLLLLPFCCVDAVGYSYTRFIGPVAGPEHRIYVNDVDVAAADGDDTTASRLDYVAKPEYQFAYGVEDAQAHILHNRNEMRDGDAVKGVYSVVDPDGSLRVVKYTADTANGFQAEVIRNGISSLYGHKQDDIPSKDTPNNYNYNDQQQNHPPFQPYQPSLNDPLNPANLEHYPYINNFYPHIPIQQYQTPPSIIFHYNNENYDDDEVDNNNNEDDVTNDSGNDNKEYQPQYEVNEKQDEGNNDNGHDNDGGGGGGNGNKKNKINHNDPDDDYSDDYDDDDNDLDDLEDYGESAHSGEVSDESIEYY